MQLHEYMRHIAFSTLQMMISKGIVHGIEVILSSEEVFCDTCVKVKITY